MKPSIAAVAAAAIALFGMAANAGPNELTEYVRKLLGTGELPRTADDAAIELVDDGRRMQLTGQQLKAVFAEQRKVISAYELKDFTLNSVKCEEQLCSIDYNYRMRIKIGDREISGSVHSAEQYRVKANGFELIRAYQVQTTERNT